MTDFFDGKAHRHYVETYNIKLTKMEEKMRFGPKYDQGIDKLFAACIGGSIAKKDHEYIAPLVGEAAIAAVNVGYKTAYPDIDIQSTNIGKVKEAILFISYAFAMISDFLPLDEKITKKIKQWSSKITCIAQGITVLSYVVQNTKDAKKLTRKRKEVQ